MTDRVADRPPRVRLRRWRPRGLSWAVLLVLGLAAGLFLDRIPANGLELLNPDRSRVSEVRAVLAQLPVRPLVLVGMDADFGTYPEIRPAVRALLADLLDREARIATVSFTPEGRAIAAAEMQRLLDSGVEPDRLLDMGFVAGAEAGLVLAVTELAPSDGGDSVARAIRGAGDGIAAFDMALVVGGIDFGPRSWVEQVTTRVPSLPVVGVVPTYLQPELAPYLRTGQLSALLGTVRDDAAYTADVADRLADAELAAVPPGTSPTGMLIGMAVALGFIGRALWLRGRPMPEVEPEPEDEA